MPNPTVGRGGNSPSSASRAATRDHSLAATEAERAAAFTPGPWHIKPGDTPGFKTCSGGAGIYAPARPQDAYFILQIAAIETNVPAREAVANARLIAAAPDLLAAVERAIRHATNIGISDTGSSYFRTLIEARAKALGPSAQDTAEAHVKAPGMPSDNPLGQQEEG